MLRLWSGYVDFYELKLYQYLIFYQLIFFLVTHLSKRALYFASKISLGGNSGSFEYKSAF